jgi:hypothetical protein
VPLWTAPALDRCLFLALIYPITAIFLIWAISGQVGPAEASLGMRYDVPGWSRAQLWLIFGDGVNQAADLASGATSIPSWNLTPWMTFGNWC